ncbi:hydrogenase/urease maturation nickel metallochaperone HypA [Thermodesulfobacteriota bacterium B35]
MHELSLAQGLLEQLDELARRHHADQILRVEVAIGREAGIVTDSFVFGFNAIKKTLPSTRTTILAVTATGGRDLVLGRVEMECDDHG